MRVKYYDYLELSGLFIAIFATVFQVFFLNTINDLSTDAAFYRLEQKMYVIRAEVRGHAGQTSMDENNLENYWNQVSNEGARIAQQRKIINQIFATLSITGACLFFYARIVKIKQQDT